jgi:hypothetical protein
MNIAKWRLQSSDFRLCLRVFCRLLKGDFRCHRRAILWGLYYAIREVSKIENGLLSGLILRDENENERIVIGLIVAELLRMGCFAPIEWFSIDWAVELLSSENENVVKSGLVCIEMIVEKVDLDLCAFDRLMDDSGFLVKMKIGEIVLKMIENGIERVVEREEFFSVVRKLLDGGEENEIVWKLIARIVDSMDWKVRERLRSFGIEEWIENEMMIEIDNAEISELKSGIVRVLFC